MGSKKVEIKKLFLTIIFIIGILLILGNKSFAVTNEYIKTITEKSGITDIVGQVDLEIQEDGKIYEYASFIEEKTDVEKKMQKQTTEQKELSSNSKQYLDEHFEELIQYEDEQFKGELQLVDYNIETINNGFIERIDSKEIILTNMPTNDLSQVDKTKIINGREYVLINVNWESEENQEIDNTLVPKQYKGTAIYQCVIRTEKPSTYKVSANYMGEVESKEQLSNYIITYKLKEQPKGESNIVTSIVIVAGGIIVLGILVFLLKPNATIYNVQNGNKIVKIKSAKIRNGAMIDITNKIQNISGNNFILQINSSTLNRLLNKTIVIKLNNQNKKVMIISGKNYFNF